jgi:hypothetical protein
MYILYIFYIFLNMNYTSASVMQVMCHSKYGQINFSGIVHVVRKGHSNGEKNTLQPEDSSACGV